MSLGFDGFGGGGDCSCAQSSVDGGVVDVPSDVVYDVPCSDAADVVVDGGAGKAARHGRDKRDDEVCAGWGTCFLAEVPLVAKDVVC